MTLESLIGFVPSMSRSQQMTSARQREKPGDMNTHEANNVTLHNVTTVDHFHLELNILIYKKSLVFLYVFQYF